MASHLAKAPLLRSLNVRGLASQAQCVPIGGLKEYDIKTLALPNNVLVSCAETESQMARLGVFFKAGSRFETPDNLGATHIIRIAAGLSTCNRSQFAITRNLQQLGATLTCSSDRETVAYTLEATQSALEDALDFLAEVSSRPCFKPWELSDNQYRVKIDLKNRLPQARVIDILHKAAFRKQGLGNSLYISKHQLGKISSETLQHYVTHNFTTNRTAVVGLGVNESALKDFANCLSLDCGEDKSPPNEYKGGEIRFDKGGQLAHIAVAGEGGSMRNAKEALAFAVLQRALGTGSHIKYAKENSGCLGKTLENCAHPSNVTAFNVSYSDTGLFGALISAPSADAGKILKETVEILKCGTVSDEDVERGKNQLKADILLGLECGLTSLEDIGRQAALLGCVASGPQIVKAVDSISTGEVNLAMKKLSCAPLSLAARGNLQYIPFLDELK